MTKMDLFREIGMIDEKYVVEAEAVKRSALISSVWRRSLATAACLCLCIGLYFSVQRLGYFSSSDTTAIENASPMEATAEGMENRMEAYTEEPEEGEERATEDVAGAKYETAEEESAIPENKEQLSVSSTQSTSLDSKEDAAEDLYTIEKRFAGYSDETEKLVEEGLVVNLHGKLKGGQERLDAFIKNVEEGKAADMDLVQYTVEGDPIFYYIQYDGTDFYAVMDYSRDAFAGSGEKIHEYHYKYFKVFEEDIEGETRITLLLTDEKDLTWEKYVSGEGKGFSVMSYTK